MYTNLGNFISITKQNRCFYLNNRNLVFVRKFELEIFSNLSIFHSGSPSSPKEYFIVCVFRVFRPDHLSDWLYRF